MTLPTGKEHISFSEMTDWVLCPFRHKLLHIERVRPGYIGPALTVGTAIHHGCEQYLSTGTHDLEGSLKMISDDFDMNKEKLEYSRYSQKNMEANLEAAAEILLEVPEFFDSTFPGWKFVAAEQDLYERLDKFPDTSFKGFIDAVITAPGRRKNTVTTWILDFKTCTFGWTREHKQDVMARNQLILYKTYWCKKKDIDPKDVRAAFVLLKKTGKSGQRCELVDVSAGDVTRERAVKLVESMVSSLKRGISIKNRTSCSRCDMRETVHCP